jgi:hypothetical protein
LSWISENNPGRQSIHSYSIVTGIVVKFVTTLKLVVQGTVLKPFRVVYPLDILHESLQSAVAVDIPLGPFLNYRKLTPLSGGCFALSRQHFRLLGLDFSIDFGALGWLVAVQLGLSIPS